MRMMKKRQATKNRAGKEIVSLLGVIIVLALCLQADILNSVNTRNINKTSEVLLDQAIGIIEKNQQSEKDMIESLKEDYIVRAKTVAYILDAKPEAEKDTEELQKIADLMSIDEIHLFNENGNIYSGTVPKYYGYGFNSGEQISYFKPMLKDKSLTMCQDVTPNTSEGKKMMYAITWNEAGTRMIEVGIEPVRLLEEVKQNEVDNVVSNMPMYEGMKLYVADSESGEIYGATDETEIGRTLDEIGIPQSSMLKEQTVTEGLNIKGKRYQCVFEKSGDYAVGVTFAIASDNENNLVAILLVAVYLLVAAAGILFLVNRVLKANREKKEQFDILASMAEIYHSMHLIHLEKNTVVKYSDTGEKSEMGKAMKDADQVIADLMKNTALEVYGDQAENFVDFRTLGKRMEGKKIISAEFVGKDLGWFRASFIAIETDKNGQLKKVIFTIQSIEDEKRKEEKLIFTSHTDQLTGCFNRRAYEKDIAELSLHTEFIYMSMDVNGLKIVNDGLGHAAGDELLQGAAACMKQSFDSYGKVYRIGGDEFIAILFTDPENFEEIKRQFEETVENWSGQWIESLTVSSGYVSSKEQMWFSIKEMAKVADERMYEKKAMYYRKNGVDRRGQPAAYLAICKLYSKILRIDLNEDSYRVLNWEESEKEAVDKRMLKETESLSELLRKLEDPEKIHPDDREKYQKQTDPEYLRQYFDEKKKRISITYRRKEKEQDKIVTMEIIPSDDYNPENRVGFLYVKG